MSTEAQSNPSRYIDDDGNRHYVKEGVDVLSVTTILNYLDTDTSGLDYWKDKNNGKGDNADWEHLFKYKTERGTLLHYAALSTLTDLEWTDDEQSSLDWVLANKKNDDIVYSLLKDNSIVQSRGEYDHIMADETNLMDIYGRDKLYFTQAFTNVCSATNISLDNVIEVEKFTVNKLPFEASQFDAEAGYGGQVDLVYRDDKTAENVVCDLKTSSALRKKNKLQLAAYAKSIEADPTFDVDEIHRVEVCRICPDKDDVALHTTGKTPTKYHTAMRGSIDEYYEEFKDVAYSVYDSR